MQNPLLQVHEIDNGYLITLAPNKPVLVDQRGMPQAGQDLGECRFATDYEDVCEIIKAKFPPK